MEKWLLKYLKLRITMVKPKNYHQDYFQKKINKMTLSLNSSGLIVIRQAKLKYLMQAWHMPSTKRDGPKTSTRIEHIPENAIILGS